jgi:hypothetical protein
MNREPDIVSRGKKDETNAFHSRPLTAHPLLLARLPKITALDLLRYCKEKGHADT